MIILNTLPSRPVNCVDKGLESPVSSQGVLECPKCAGVMIKSTALVGAPRGITYEGEWPKKLMDCLKCGECGHSETIPQAEVHFVVPKA